ncbi:MAG: hypothetical protein EBZ74_02220 [Planctomycetia bacterium]|nr:hypothetical protein [Planctomycetia bacterium]
MARRRMRPALAVILAAILVVAVTEVGAGRQAVAQPAGPQAGAAAKAGDAARPRMQQADPAAAAPAPPAAEEEAESRPAGGALAILPAVAWWLIVVCWAATTAWAGRDKGQVPTFAAVWLPILSFPFFLVALAAWWVPWSVVACGLTAAAWLGSFVPYALARDRTVPPERRVMSIGNATAAAARGLQPWLRRLGIKLEVENRSLADTLPEVAIAAQPAADAAAPEARLAEAAAAEGFGGFRELVQRCMALRAEQALFEIGAQGAAVRQRIDGVWQPLRRLVKRRQGLKTLEEWDDASQLDKDETQHLLGVVKKLCGISSKAAKRQSGEFLVTLQRRSIPCRVTLEKGESALRMLWDFQPPPAAFASIEALGMEEADTAKVKTALTLVNSLVVISAPSGEGLRTTFNQVVLAADRLLRDFVLLEDVKAPFREIQNVKPWRWGGADGRSAATVLEEAMRGYPTALVVPQLDDGPLAVELVKRAEEMLVIVGVRSRDVVEAIERLVALGVPRDALGRTLQVATGQRLLRRVCPKCAEDYPPSADLLGRLKVGPQEGLVFKRARASGCPACSGTGHLGRGALFEVIGGPTVSQAIVAGADRATLVKAAQRDGMRRLKDAGISLVTAGVTTLEEVQRILKSSGS